MDAFCCLKVTLVRSSAFAPARPPAVWSWTRTPRLASARQIMTEQEETLKLLSDLLLVETDTATVHVGPQARRGLIRLKTAIEDSDLETVIRSSNNDSLPLPAGHLTAPEIRYFNLYRESFTMEHIHAPETNRKLISARSGGGCVAGHRQSTTVSIFFL